jgi:hypothetical protein
MKVEVIACAKPFASCFVWKINASFSLKKSEWEPQRHKGHKGLKKGTKIKGNSWNEIFDLRFSFVFLAPLW